MRDRRDPRHFPRTATALLALSIAVSGCSSSTSKDAPSPSPVANWSGAALPTKQMSAADAKPIDEMAQAALEQNPDLPGMWIGVWDPNKGVHIAAYGNAVDGGAAAKVDDHSRIGSVTKTFTATAVLEQVAAGKLNLDDTVADVLPDMAKQYPDLATITVEQLLAMRSGIPDYANTGVVTGAVVKDPTKVWTVDEIIGATLDAMPVEPPGTPGYSTTNYLILGEMLTAVTGRSVEDVINGVVAEAGLTTSSLQPPEETQMPAPASHGYLNAPGVQSLAASGIEAKPGQDVTDWTVSWGQAGGGMYSTVADMGTWASTGLGTSLLPQALDDRRLKAEPIPEGKYGLGVFDYGNGWIGHTGQLIGWESVVAYNKKTGAAFVALVNETGSLTAALQPLAVAFPDLMQGIAGG